MNRVIRSAIEVNHQKALPGVLKDIRTVASASIPVEGAGVKPAPILQMARTLSSLIHGFELSSCESPANNLPPS